MAIVCWCKLYSAEDDAWATGMNYYNASANPEKKFSYKVRKADGQWELKVCFEYNEDLSWDLEQAGFHPCSSDAPNL